jgi:hypothetical protein
VIQPVPSHHPADDHSVRIETTSPSAGHPLRHAPVVKHEETCVILATIGAILGFVVAFWGVGVIVEHAFPDSDWDMLVRFALGVPATYVGTFLGVGPVAHFCDTLFAPAARR